MKNRYVDAVAAHSLVKVRIMLADELLLDPRGVTFLEMLDYAKENLSDLFEPDKSAGYSVSPDRETWDINLLSTIKQELVSNFSVEKLELFREVAMEVGKEKARALSEDENWQGVNQEQTVFFDRDNTPSILIQEKKKPLYSNDKTGSNRGSCYNNSSAKASENIPSNERLQNRLSILGSMQIDFSLKELAKQIGGLVEYLSNDTYEIKSSCICVRRLEKTNWAYRWWIWEGPSYEFKEEPKWFVRVSYVGVDNNVLRLSYTYEYGLNDSPLIRSLKKKRCIIIDKSNSSICIDLCKIKYLANILSKGVVESVSFNECSVRMNVKLLVDSVC